MKYAFALFSILLITGCQSVHEREFEKTEDVALHETMTYVTAHGITVQAYPNLFDKGASIKKRMKEARDLIRFAWVELEQANMANRVDAMSELSMMLSTMLSYARERE